MRDGQPVDVLGEVNLLEDGPFGCLVGARNLTKRVRLRAHHTKSELDGGRDRVGQRQAKEKPFRLSDWTGPFVLHVDAAGPSLVESNVRGEVVPGIEVVVGRALRARGTGLASDKEGACDDVARATAAPKS